MNRIFDTKFGRKSIEIIIWRGGEIPKTVYKYRDWNNSFHRKILSQQQIYLPSPAEFNDPFDCKLPIAYHLLENDTNLELEYISAFVNKYYAALSPELKEAKIKKILAQGNYKKPEAIYELNNEIQEYINNYAGIYCITAIRDNILMWSHYANNHTGFCVGFNSKLLFDCFHEGQDINYVKDFPLISPIDEKLIQWNKLVFTKSDMWDYEIEYRLYKQGKTKTTFTIPRESITEIIVGYKMEETDIIDLRKIVSCELPHANLFITKPKENKFEFEIIPL